ncbi:hypothetical protein AB0F11_05525 [Streptomyces sp. NPDC032472]|uniref:hypothetical protein n=1 Tax=Streptomyces sp. NPDC032472 TaxID=3155018 RepID=UPI0033D302A5
MMLLVAAGAALGCSKEAPPAAPQLPERSCFGVFTRDDLAPLVGKGREVKEVSPVDLRLTADRNGGTCNVYVDGKDRVLAWATRQPLGQHLFTNVDDQHPDPLPYAEHGKVWDSGALVTLTCTGAEDSFELELWLSGTVQSADRPGASRPVLTALMQKYLAAAKQQTQCGGTH